MVALQNARKRELKMYVITNMTDKPLTIDGVSIEPKEQLSIASPSEEMLKAKAAGTLRILNSDETLEERKADVEALKPFKGPL